MIRYSPCSSLLSGPVRTHSATVLPLGTSVVATYLGVGLAVSVAMHNSKKLFTL